MTSKLQRARQNQVPLVVEAVPEMPTIGKFIRHQQPAEVESMESKMAEPGSNISHLNGRLSILYMGYRDLKIWLREMESYLNLDARYSAMEAINKHFDEMQSEINQIHKEVHELRERLDDALKEE